MIGVEQEAFRPHAMGRPPTSTVAVTCPVRPVESTLSEGVPCPPVTVPAETSQLKLFLTAEAATSTSALKFISSPGRTLSGQETLMAGHCCAATSMAAWRVVAVSGRSAMAVVKARRLTSVQALLIRRALCAAPAERCSALGVNSGGRAAVAAELRAGGDGRVAVLAGLGLERLAAVVAELRAGLHLALTMRAGLGGGLLRLRVRAAVLAELRARRVRRVALRARHGLLRAAAALLPLLLLALTLIAEGVRHHLAHAEAHP